MIYKEIAKTHCFNNVQDHYVLKKGTVWAHSLNCLKCLSIFTQPLPPSNPIIISACVSLSALHRESREERDLGLVGSFLV